MRNPDCRRLVDLEMPTPFEELPQVPTGRRDQEEFSSARPHLGIIVVAFQSHSDLQRLLPRLVSTEALRVSVIVVDNSSDTQTHRLVDSLDAPDVSYMDPDHNMGFGRASNEGAKYLLSCGVTHLLFLNPDFLLSAEWATDVALWLSAHDGQATSVIADVTLTSAVSGDRRNLEPYPTPLNEIRKSLGLRRQAPAQDDLESHYLVGSFLLLTRRAWQRLAPGFDPHFPLYGEDAALSWRIRDRKGGG